jgi:hypothetical protein
VPGRRRGLPTANRSADLDLPNGELSVGDAATLDRVVAELAGRRVATSTNRSNEQDIAFAKRKFWGV